MSVQASRRSRRATAVAITLLAALGAGVGYCVLSAVRENQEIAYLASDAHLIDEAEASVRAKLKDPASAVFSQVRIVGSGVDQRVCGLVNAKNSFGGYTGDQRFVSFLSAVAYVGEDDPPPPAMWSRKEHPCDVL